MTTSFLTDVRVRFLSALVLCVSTAWAQEPPVTPVASSGPVSKITVISRDEFRPLTGRERWGIYWRQTYWRPVAILGNAGPALGAHLSNDPPQWGQGMEGYSRRLADRVTRSAIRDTINATGSAALGYEVRYVRCDCNGFLPKFGHAMAWNFVTLNRNGKTVLNIPKIGGAFAGEFVGTTWMPPGYDATGDALRGGAVQLGVNSLFNVLREFAPRKKAK